MPQAQIVTLHNFLADPALDTLYEQLTVKPAADQNRGISEESAAGENSGTTEGQTTDRQEETADRQVEGTEQQDTDQKAGIQKEQTADMAASRTEKKQILVKEGIRLNLHPVSKERAIQAAGELLVELGYVGDAYVGAMQEREKLVSTYMGMGVAIPHGTSQAKGTVKKTGIVLLQYPEGVDFGEEKAQLVFGIAGIGDEHLDLLSKICEMLEDEEILETLKTTGDPDWILERLNA